MLICINAFIRLAGTSTWPLRLWPSGPTCWAPVCIVRAGGTPYCLTPYRGPDCRLHSGRGDRMKGLTIGRAAKLAGVGVETIRFYERRGLIQQPRKPLRSGFRIYSDEVVPRIRFIRRSQEMGFSLREIADLLSLRADPNADCAQVRMHAAAKLAEVDHKLAELNRMRAALQEIIDACPARGAARNCTILQALQPTSKRALVKSPSLRDRNRRQQTMKSITLKVVGMNCDGCAA